MTKAIIVLNVCFILFEFISTHRCFIALVFETILNYVLKYMIRPFLKTSRIEPFKRQKHDIYLTRYGIRNTPVAS